MDKLLSSMNELLDTLPNEFTTHNFILNLVKRRQHKYIKALHENLGTSAPFQSLHSKIGKYLMQSTDTITMIRSDAKDTDLFGQKSENMLWGKV